MPRNWIASTKYFLLTPLVIVGLGCSLSGGSAQSAPQLVANYNPEVASAKVVRKIIKQSDFKKALSNGGTWRAVPLLYGKESSPGYPEYRVFGVRPGSSLALLGVENADIIVAANGYVINSPEKVEKFVELLANERQATIDLRRGGRALRFEYDFVS